jgi:hypothetical protein
MNFERPDPWFLSLRPTGMRFDSPDQRPAEIAIWRSRLSRDSNRILTAICVSVKTLGPWDMFDANSTVLN